MVTHDHRGRWFCAACARRAAWWTLATDLILLALLTPLVIERLLG